MSHEPPVVPSALNIPGAQASAQVFLNVMRDALFGAGHAGLGASNLLLPRTDLSALMPEAAAQWLSTRHPDTVRLRTGERVLGLCPQGKAWQLYTAEGAETFEVELLGQPGMAVTAGQCRRIFALGVAIERLNPHHAIDDRCSPQTFNQHRYSFRISTVPFGQMNGLRQSSNIDR